MTLMEIRKRGKKSFRGWKNWTPIQFWKEKSWNEYALPYLSNSTLKSSHFCHTEELLGCIQNMEGVSKACARVRWGASAKPFTSGPEQSLQTAAEHSAVRTRMLCILERAHLEDILGSPSPTHQGERTPPRKWSYWLLGAKGMLSRWMQAPYSGGWGDPSLDCRKEWRDEGLSPNTEVVNWQIDFWRWCVEAEWFSLGPPKFWMWGLKVRQKLAKNRLSNDRGSSNDRRRTAWRIHSSQKK